MNKEKIAEKVNSMQEEIIELSKKFVSINSVNPRTYGPGEKEVSEMLEKYLNTMKFDEIKIYKAPDDIVECGYRPNIVAKYSGTSPEKTVWFITHMDKVPAGDLSLWDTDPFVPTVKDGKIFGRGSEDNGSSLVATIMGLKALMELGVKPKNNIALALVSDEETGSKYGIQYLLEQGVFGDNDWFFVPDGGSEKGDFIEIAEKSRLAFEVSVKGKQAHASMPNLAVNAHRHGMLFNSLIDTFLHENYSKEDILYMPPYSSFEPTIKTTNVENINTIPGTDSVKWDCRVLPDYDVNVIFSELEKLAEKYSAENNVKISLIPLGIKNSPKPTDSGHEMISYLKKAIKEMRNIEASTGGIGGGTCAAFLRSYDLPAVVWATMDEMAHQPNEYIKIEHLLADTAVYTKLMSEL